MFTQKDRIKSYFVPSHPVGHYVNMASRSSGPCYQTGDADTVSSGSLSSYLSCNFLILQPFSTLSILLSTVWQGTIVYYPKDNKMCQSLVSILSFSHVNTLKKCGYSEADGSNTLSNIWFRSASKSISLLSGDALEGFTDALPLMDALLLSSRVVLCGTCNRQQKLCYLACAADESVHF